MSKVEPAEKLHKKGHTLHFFQIKAKSVRTTIKELIVIDEISEAKLCRSFLGKFANIKFAEGVP